MLAKKANERLDNLEEGNLIPWDEAAGLAGWEDDDL